MGCVNSKRSDKGEEVRDEEEEEVEEKKVEAAPSQHTQTPQPQQTQPPAKVEESILEEGMASYGDVRLVYDIGREIGSGAWSVVFEGVHKESGERVAIKRILKKSYDADKRINIVREIKNMKKLQHPNIVKLLEVIEDDKHLWLIMELIEGEELFDRIVAKGHYTEKDAANVMRQVVAAVAYLHSQGVTHRDLKPENLLTKGGDENEIVKVADFGLSKDNATGDLKTWCGTPTYVAPEVLEKTLYTKAVDMWSIGVILYILLVGYPPFAAETNPRLYQMIRDVKYTFIEEDWRDISQEAQDLIKKLLVKDPNQRLTAEQCLAHPWFTLVENMGDKGNMQIDRLKKYQEQMHLQQPDQ